MSVAKKISIFINEKKKKNEISKCKKIIRLQIENKKKAENYFSGGQKGVFESK